MAVLLRLRRNCVRKCTERENLFYHYLLWRGHWHYQRSARFTFFSSARKWSSSIDGTTWRNAGDLKFGFSLPPFLGVTANTMYCAAFLKAPPLLSGPYVHLGRQAWEAGKERLCMYMKKKPGSLQDRLGKERGLEAEWNDRWMIILFQISQIWLTYW